ncbi:MAG: methylated-DNA--[protein]-cysteine S-methyltransferase [Oscillospiraceae bacterium]|nr:methylated-DNA--[protein]-cysteine S-methyltransferase [Oscillospiraceae bacterium]
MQYTVIPSPVGELTLASDGESLTGLWIKGQKYFGGPERAEKTDLPIFRRTEEWLSRYFAGERPSTTELPLSPRGSEFRRIVWRLLCEIPYGEVTTYGELSRRAAKILGKETMAAQAIGGAVGHNPISIIIPCHRVLGSDGSLTGYAGGLHIKQRLLEHEGRPV